MASSIAVLATLGFIGWIIYRAVKGKPIRAHTISYSIACVAGIFTYAFFLSMNIDKPVKIVASILIGIVLIIVAALLQRREPSKP